MMTDPIADMLTRIRNANTALHDQVEMPASGLKTEVANVLKDQGYISDFELREGRVGQDLVIRLKYSSDRRRVISGLERVSKPGRRVYVDKTGSRACSAAWASPCSRPRRASSRVTRPAVAASAAK